MPNYKLTTKACYLSYMVQALVINLPPLLFTTFVRLYRVTSGQLGLLVFVLFLVQIAIDLLSTPLVRLLGYRKTMLYGHAASALGMVLLAVLPGWFGFGGILAAICLAAVGSGVVEVLVSPIVQAIPDDTAKAGAMSLLHSFYCWGMAVVVLVSTLLLKLVGWERWRILPLFWLFLPVGSFVLFLFVPIATLSGDERGGLGLKDLLRRPVFWILMGMMPLASASELAMSQWASYFAEAGLGVEKAAGDLLGPCMFAVMQALMRVWYSRQRNLSCEKLVLFSSFLCMFGYFWTVHAPSPLLSLAGCALVGFAVGSFWPSTFSLAADFLPNGGTLMYSLLAFCGDVGCALGPQIVAGAPSVVDGFERAMILPALMALCVLVLHRREKEAPHA